MKKINFGKLKTWYQRLTQYVGIVNFAMLFYLFVSENAWFDWYIWMILIIVVTISIISFDVLIVMEQQLDYGFIKNPEWRKHKRNQKRIMEHLGLEYEE